MNYQFMSYSREANGLVVRNHKKVLITEDDLLKYTVEENLLGWPELCVRWRVMADSSCVGIAPMTEVGWKLFARHKISTE